MEVTIARNEHLLIDDARIAFRNFAGVGTEFNREGDRNFSWVIEDPELADELIHRGWNVKVRPPRDPDGEPFIHMPVKVKMGGSTVVKLVRQTGRNHRGQSQVPRLHGHRTNRYGYPSVRLGDQRGQEV
mgnify:CR=1 FL=1